jgi:uncharacterized protein with HEPN domain
MKPDPTQSLEEIVEAYEAIRIFLAGVDFANFDASDPLTSQVYWKLTLMGEAANRALRGRPSLETELPELINLAEVRNRVIHGYDSIDNLIVWTVIHERIPPVVDQIRQLLDEM